ncbi:MAG: hypothetical protein ACJZ1Y_04325, partial [Candidatus Neomarinimicrobiota bacterium]
MFYKAFKKEKLKFLALRKVPVDKNILGKVSKKSKPRIVQIIFSSKTKNTTL